MKTSSRRLSVSIVLALIALVVTVGAPIAFTASGEPNPMPPMNMPQFVSPTPATHGEMPPATATPESFTGYTPAESFTLRTGVANGRLVYLGVGNGIDGIINPALRVNVGDVVQVTLINGEGAEHDIIFPDNHATSDHVTRVGASSTIVFRADKPGAYPYFCSLPGHREAGMEGRLVVGEIAPVPVQVGVSISREPTDLPEPIGNRPPQLVRVDLQTLEVEGRLADGVTYTYWTFNGKVPGPFVRVRVGDTVELHLKNEANSHMVHSIDLHAVTGPGGGATVMQVPPGGEKSFTFKAIIPGLFMYHCATPMVSEHISSGMYGLILVEPEGGLPKVDREFYVMQGELYTRDPLGKQGHQEFSVEKLLAERPEYVLLNGAVGALTMEHPLTARVGETIRIFFGVGGPNLTSSFHIIGEMLDRVYNQASLTSAPLTNVQTTTVAPGGATVVDLHLEVPGRYILVDHALSRMERGLMGFLNVEGAPNPDVFHAGPAK